MRCQTVMMLVLTGGMLTGAFLPHPRLHLWSPGRAPQSHTAVMTEGSSEAMRTVEVGLGERAYPIYIGSGILGPENSELVRQHVKGRKVLIVTNDRIAPLWLSRCEATFRDSGDLDIETLVVPDGEAHKTMDTIMMIMQKALESRMDRKSTFIALGGGVIGDMVGFAAATYQRGVNFIQIPTTLMAMVDSSVGGKTGVNHPLGKNMIGSFHQPQCVLIDTETLSTLPDREFFSGISEVVKYGLIRDARFFQWQEANMDALVQRDDDTVARAVELSCVNKAEVVAADEREAGVRATLNLGHTFGHAIETGMGYGSWLHGEAVSVGMAMAADMSAKLGWIEADLLRRTTDLLTKANLPITLPEDCPLTHDDFTEMMSLDKKVADGTLRLILLKGALGECVFTSEFDQEALDLTLAAYTREKIPVSQ